MKDTGELKLNEKIEVEKAVRGMKLKSAIVDCSQVLLETQPRWTFGSEGSLVSTVSTREGRSLSTQFAVCS